MAECAIPMCGCEDADDLVPCCENGHSLHRQCLSYLGDVVCPLCRSDKLKYMTESVVVPMSALCRTPYSLFGATIAVYIGQNEFKKAVGQRNMIVTLVQ